MFLHLYDHLFLYTLPRISHSTSNKHIQLISQGRITTLILAFLNFGT